MTKTIVATLDHLKEWNDDRTYPLRSLRRYKEKKITNKKFYYLIVYWFNLNFESFFRPVSRSRSKSGSPNYGKRNGGGGGGGGAGRRVSRSRSPGDN